MTAVLSVLFYLFSVASGYCIDKSLQISEIAVKLLAVLIQKIGGSFVQLNHTTLQELMKNLLSLVDGKRQNLRNLGLDICLSIYANIGSENYLSLMNYSLKP
jgi:molybdopterin converting factor small subunit